MEQINLLINGLDTDTHPIKQKEHSVREILNFVPLSDDGNIYSITNEDGTRLFEKVSFPVSFKPIGFDVLDNDIIVVLANPQNYSQVGYIRQDNSDLDPTYGFYHPVAPYDKDTDSYPEDNSEFGFQLTHPVDCVSRKIINGHRVLYFTDNLNPYGRVDLDDPPLVGTVKDQVKLTFNQSIPTMSIREIRENVSGSFKPGIYQVITRYVTNNGGVTNFGIPSEVIPMVPTTRSEGIDNYHGAFNEDGTINKNILVTFNDVDTQYQELEVVLIYYEGTQSVFKSSIIGQIPINSDTIDYTITGIDAENLIDITREELNRLNITYTRAKCIEQKDNTLFLSNLSSDRQNFYDEIQLAANQARISYRIKEVQYSGRGSNSQSSDLFFTILTPYVNSLSTIGLPFNKELDQTAGVNDVLANYVLKKPGLPSIGDIKIDNNNPLTDGDTITIGAGPSQASVVFTLETTASANPNRFLKGGTAEETAVNLRDAINDSTDVTEYLAVLDAADLTKVFLVWNTVVAGSDGTTIVSSTGSITTNNFAGYDPNPVEINPIAISVGETTIILQFNTAVSTSDEIQILDVKSTESETYTTGDDSFIAIAPEEPNSGNTSSDLGYTDYLNEQLTFDSKTYRRDEVYSFGICLIYDDGTTSPVFHIPGFAGYVNETDYQGGKLKFAPTGVDAWGSYNTGASSGLLGTYVSEDTYPNDQNYPGNETGDDNSTALPSPIERNIRHHYMPRLENEPHFRVQGNTTFIRLINLEFDISLPLQALTDVQKVMFVRERRSNATNRSILAQGIVNKEGIMADDFDNDGYIADDGQTLTGGSLFPSVKQGYFASEMPFANNMNLFTYSGIDYEKTSGNSARGLAFPEYASPFPGGSYGDGTKLATDFLKNRCFFYSPETVLFTGFRFESDQVEQGELDPVMRMKGVAQILNERQDEWQYDVGQDWLAKYQTADLFADYVNYEAETNPNPLIIQIARYLDAGQYRAGILDSSEPGIRTSTRWNTSTLEMKLDGDLPNANTDPNDILISIDYQAGVGDVNFGCILNCSGTKKRGSIIISAGGDELARYLYNVKIKNLRQYGQISFGSFVPISLQKPFTDNGSVVTTFTNVYGGDTFITKFSFNNTCLVPVWPYRRDGNKSINRPDRSNSQRLNSYAHIDGVELGGTTSGGPGKAHGKDYRTCNYFFVESNINTYYRHTPEDEELQDYFPNENNVSSLLENFIGYLDNIRAYNAQYSYENNVREFFVRGSTETQIGKFENRTIYSETAANDDTLDAYRSFLVNNYYDLPADTGPIWDSFVSYNSLFLHTTKSLWITFAEPSATISGGNISDAVLGTGGLFQRPSKEVITTEGGYAGTISQWGGSNTKMGYIFPDVLQGKVFGLFYGDGGPYLKDLSEVGSQTFFKKNLQKDLIEINGEIDEGLLDTPHLIDNPYQQIGLSSCYDQNLKRFILIKHGTTPISRNFSMINQQWSNHSYYPSVMIAYNNQLFFIDETAQFWEMNKGRKGEYFGNFFPSKIEFICNFQAVPKVFKNIYISSESTGEDGLKKREDCFHSLQVFTDRQNTFEVALKPANTFNVQQLPGETLIKFRNDEYRIAIPRDSVIDNSGDVFDFVNNRDFTQKFRERIKGDYAHVVLTYNNTENNYEFVVNSVNVRFDLNAR